MVGSYVRFSIFIKIKPIDKHKMRDSCERQNNDIRNIICFRHLMAIYKILKLNFIAALKTEFIRAVFCIIFDEF